MYTVSTGMAYCGSYCIVQCVCILLYEAHGIVCVFCSGLDDVCVSAGKAVSYSGHHCIVQFVHFSQWSNGVILLNNCTNCIGLQRSTKPCA